MAPKSKPEAPSANRKRKVTRARQSTLLTVLKKLTATMFFLKKPSLVISMFLVIARMVQVCRAYQATIEGELTLRYGQNLMLRDKKDGQCYGFTLDGKFGYFPYNCILDLDGKVSFELILFVRFYVLFNWIRMLFGLFVILSNL